MVEAPKVASMVASWNVHRGTSPEMALESARRAERMGLDGIIVGDHVTFFGGGFDGLMTLTAMAAVTERIELKTCVYLLPLRHPVPVALQVAQLDQLANGRFVFGVGIGGEDPHEFTSCGVNPKHRGARTNEALAILRRLWTEDNVSFQGKHFQLDAVTVNPKPIGHVPVYIGGRSDAALVRTGRFGDGYTGIWQSLERFKQLQEVVGEAAVGAGRDPAAIEYGMQFWTCIGQNRDEAKARVGRAMEGMYRLPFERFERYTPYGTAREVAEHIARYVEAGAKHVNLIPVQGSPDENIERAAEVREELLGLVGTRHVLRGMRRERARGQASNDRE